MPTENDTLSTMIVKLMEQHQAETAEDRKTINRLTEQLRAEAEEHKKAIDRLTAQQQKEAEESKAAVEQLNEQHQAAVKQLAEQNQAVVDGLTDTIKNLRQTIVNLQETIDSLNRRLFGTSSEKIPGQSQASGSEGNKTGQEKPDTEEVPENDQETVTVETGHDTTVRGYTRKAGKKTLRTDLYQAVPVRDVYIDAKGRERLCPDCGAEMNHLGYEQVREELRISPAKAERVRIFREKMVCPVCKDEMVTTIVEGPSPRPLLAHSPASASSVAYVMYEKSCKHMPFYRQEADWKEHGVPLPRETQANWYNKCAVLYLEPVYNRLHAELILREVLHTDEVPCQVLHEKDKTPESKSYMWIYLTGTDGLPAIVLYEYCAGRSGDYPIDFLKGFSGMLHCDGYAAYGRIEDVILVCCLAHARRKFFDAIPAARRKEIKLLDINSEQTIPEPDSPAGKDLLPAEAGVIYCNRIFYLERLYKDLDADKRMNKRNETEPQIWNEFWTWLETLNPTGGSKLEKAVNYAQNHRETLVNYLKDGRCEVSNNAAERRAKTYATGRKNFLFHNTETGAKASAIVLSLIETAKANHLNVFQYLYTLLLYMPDYLNEPAGIEQLMPWSDFIKEHCSGPANIDKNTVENRDPLPI